jgi:hypothetical protein
MNRSVSGLLMIGIGLVGGNFAWIYRQGLIEGKRFEIACGRPLSLLCAVLAGLFFSGALFLLVELICAIARAVRACFIAPRFDESKLSAEIPTPLPSIRPPFKSSGPRW